jgi:23S rRNA pseudouridine2605 synthase
MRKFEIKKSSEAGRSTEQSARGRSDARPYRKSENSSSDKPSYDRPSSGRPSSGRPSSGRPSSGRPSSGRPSSGRPSSGRPSSGRPSYDRSSSDERPSFGRSSERRPSFGRGSSDRPSYDKSSSDERPSFGRSSERRPSFGRGSSDRPSYGRGSSDRPSYGRGSSDRPSYDKSSSDERPSFGRSSERRPSFGRGSSDRPSYDRPSFDKNRRIIKKKPTAKKREDGLVRLNKFIANSGICSRREADEYITAGLVTVNGEVINQLGVRVNPADDIRFNGERLKGEEKVYILMNKPKDFVTTLSDPNAEKTVMELIAGKCPQRVYPVGRLDKQTTGVLLLTNDGELADNLTHPSNNRKKIYHVVLDKNLSKPHFDEILKGIVLEDGEIHADSLSYVDEDNSQVGLEIHSGRNRVVRRIFEHLGYKVKRLDRVYFAGLTKKSLRRGQWRFLTEYEVSMLKMGSYE